jgi:hypothetical protein
MNEWKFGPFPAGLDQFFEVPDDHIIGSEFLQMINMPWVTELDLDGIASPMSPSIRASDGNEPITSPVDLLPPLSPPVENSGTIIDTSPSTMGNQKQEKTPSEAPEIKKYHLIVVMKPSETTKDSNFGLQATMVVFGPSKDKRIEIKQMKKIALVRVLLLRSITCFITFRKFMGLLICQAVLPTEHVKFH